MTDTNQDPGSRDTESLKKDLDALREDLKTLADDVRNSGEKQAQERLDQMRDYYEDLRKQTNKYSKDMSAEIEARPFTCVFAAFGIGVILGRLLGR
jgi:ElaB/YqjD/DUF883 family membrane-anchored ribosome-binding protein